MEDQIREELYKMLDSDKFGNPDEINEEIERIIYGRNTYKRAEWRLENGFKDNQKKS